MHGRLSPTKEDYDVTPGWPEFDREAKNRWIEGVDRNAQANGMQNWQTWLQDRDRWRTRVDQAYEITKRAYQSLSHSLILEQREIINMHFFFSEKTTNYRELLFKLLQKKKEKIHRLRQYRKTL
ncbi:jg20620 [Pararge aegeria aegeria]|uniref:Jg20620 protein n=1 Tax=Pararge aegeria aegeria TaxID=348720 RepID=A0A8S4R6A9_9NEOP|nr:jg20620 [Pararge aegeria aegeria]